VRLLERSYTRFHRAGAGLDEAAKKRMAEINERLAHLGTSFSHHLLGDEQVEYVAATMYKSDDFRPYLYKTADYGKTWTMITNGLNANVYNRCVREDPTHKGLLYAGMETGIMVSFDDGTHWQSLQLNLPNTPVHDIQVAPREHDLVIATLAPVLGALSDRHGRVIPPLGVPIPILLLIYLFGGLH
jgi:hypothetical protein